MKANGTPRAAYLRPIVFKPRPQRAKSAPLSGAHQAHPVKPACSAAENLLSGASGVEHARDLSGDAGRFVLEGAAGEPQHAPARDLELVLAVAVVLEYLA